MTDLYETLGVARDADAATIKRAYRKQAAKNHPDREGGDKEKFQEVARAYETLSDDDRRKRYDKTGDDKPEKNPVTELLLTLFDAVIDDEDFTGDYVKACMAHVTKKIAAVKADLTKARREIMRLTKIEKRVVAKSGENFFASVVQSKIQRFAAARDALDKQIETLAELKDALRDYQDTQPGEDRPEAPQDPVRELLAMIGGRNR